MQITKEVNPHPSHCAMCQHVENTQKPKIHTQNARAYTHKQWHLFELSKSLFEVVTIVRKINLKCNHDIQEGLS